MAGAVGSVVADEILARKEEFARDITAALYSRVPDLSDRHGERGRSKCLQDMRYNLEHLAPAVALDDDSLFVGYAIWLQDMLAARGVGGDEVRLALELTAATLVNRLPAARSMLATSPVYAALGALTGGGVTSDGNAKDGPGGGAPADGRPG
jgi:MerR family transcriptional regulator, light-induced transcriptional regulator